MATEDQKELIQRWKHRRRDDRIMSGFMLFFASLVVLDIVMTPFGRGMAPGFPITLPISLFSIMIGMTLETGDVKQAWRKLCRLPRDVVLNFRSFYVAANPEYDEEEIKAWVKANCRWLVAPRKESIWEFSSEEDAMRFKLSWM